jgi:hypothetical protein
LLRTGEIMSKRIRNLIVGLGTVIALTASMPAAYAHDPVLGVVPAAVDFELDPGQSVEVDKVVHTAEIPPKPDIMFLADTTGSMGGAIGDVQTNVQNVINAVRGAQPTAEFGVSQYKDQEHGCPSDPFDFNLDQPLTSNDADVVTAVNSWSASGGCDTPENQLEALYQLATDPAVGFRSGSTRIVAWFGDAPAHEDTPSLADTIAALQAAGIRVVAVNSGFGGLDDTGQATAITNATDGVLLTTTDDVAAAILAGIEAIEVEVTPSVGICDPNLTVGFDPASQTVQSGDDAAFQETITVSPGAPQGSTLNCTVNFLIDGQPAGPDFTQTITIRVNDVTAPVSECLPATNPSGANVPTAGENPKSGQNPDGFYSVNATDNLDPNPQVFVVDTGSGTVFGPFPSGTKIKYTQADGATPSQTAIGGPDSAVAWHIRGTGDAATYSVDASGNESAPATCLVPRPPK